MLTVLYSGTPLWWLPSYILYRGVVALSQGLICTKRVHLGLGKVAFIEVRGGLYEGFHCIAVYNPFQLTWNITGKKRKSKSQTHCVGPAYPNVCVVTTNLPLSSFAQVSFMQVVRIWTNYHVLCIRNIKP